MIKYLCIIIWIASIPGNRWICDALYPENYPIGEDPWWFTFKDLCSLINLIGGFGFLQFAKHDRFGKLLGAILVGLAITDAIEKWILNDRLKFTVRDMIGILFVIFICYFEQIIHPWLIIHWPFYNKIIKKCHQTK